MHPPQHDCVYVTRTMENAQYLGCPTSQPIKNPIRRDDPAAYFVPADL